MALWANAACARNAGRAAERRQRQGERVVERREGQGASVRLEGSAEGLHDRPRACVQRPSGPSAYKTFAMEDGYTESGSGLRCVTVCASDCCARGRMVNRRHVEHAGPEHRGGHDERRDAGARSSSRSSRAWPGDRWPAGRRSMQPQESAQGAQRTGIRRGLRSPKRGGRGMRPGSHPNPEPTRRPSRPVLGKPAQECSGSGRGGGGQVKPELKVLKATSSSSAGQTVMARLRGWIDGGGRVTRADRGRVSPPACRQTEAAFWSCAPSGGRSPTHLRFSGTSRGIPRILRATG